MCDLPPVSLSSTRISSLRRRHGTSGSSPITVKVASNSPSTRNFTRPFAFRKRKEVYFTKKNKQLFALAAVVQLVGVLVPRPKGYRFDSWSGDISRLLVNYQLGYTGDQGPLTPRSVRNRATL